MASEHLEEPIIELTDLVEAGKGRPASVPDGPSPLLIGMLPGLAEKVGDLREELSLQKDKLLQLAERVTKIENAGLRPAPAAAAADIDARIDERLKALEERQNANFQKALEQACRTLRSEMATLEEKVGTQTECTTEETAVTEENAEEHAADSTDSSLGDRVRELEGRLQVLEAGVDQRVSDYLHRNIQVTLTAEDFAPGTPGHAAIENVVSVFMQNANSPDTPEDLMPQTDAPVEGNSAGLEKEGTARLRRDLEDVKKHLEDIENSLGSTLAGMLPQHLKRTLTADDFAPGTPAYAAIDSQVKQQLESVYPPKTLQIPLTSEDFAKGTAAYEAIEKQVRDGLDSALDNILTFTRPQAEQNAKISERLKACEDKLSDGGLEKAAAQTCARILREEILKLMSQS